MWYVYLIKCNDDTLYCGITNNLENRIKTHNLKKGAKYTRSRTPVFLYYFEKFDDKNSALKREIQIKKLSRQNKIELKQKDSLS